MIQGEGLQSHAPPSASLVPEVPERSAMPAEGDGQPAECSTRPTEEVLETDSEAPPKDRAQEHNAEGIEADTTAWTEV